MQCEYIVLGCAFAAHTASDWQYGVADNHTSSGDISGGIKCGVGLSFPAAQRAPNQPEPVNVPWLAISRTAPIFFAREVRQVAGVAISKLIAVPGV
jgi:hypothetical protein